jgi:hypothetical protein
MGRPVLVLPEQTQVTLRVLAAAEDPQPLDSYLAALADAGWGYQPAARVLGINREWARVRAHRGSLGPQHLPPVPELPRKPEKPAPPALSREEALRLRALNQQARQLRAEHPADDPRRLASEELSEFIDALTKRGITYRQMGAAMGIKARSVRDRLNRHGYRAGGPKLVPYRGRRPEEAHAS